jgi:hypothetical protein
MMRETIGVIRILVTVSPLPATDKTFILAALAGVEVIADENQREATLAVIGSKLKEMLDSAGVNYETV